MAQIICGVDISSEKLDARIGRAGPHLEVARTPEGIARLLEWSLEHGAELCAMEATGGYERLVLALMRESGMPAALTCPRRVRRFAQSQGVLEKTGEIDAGMIAWFAQVSGLRPLPPPSVDRQRLCALVARLRQATAIQTSQKNQLRGAQDAEARRSVESMIAFVKKDIRSLEAKVAELVGSDPLWSRLDETFRTLKGVADRTVATLIARLPEIGTVSNKAIAKLAGLAPIVCERRGSWTGRHISGGRQTARCILHLAGDMVRKYDDGFRDFHRRLTAAGKAKKVIRIALARKLLVQLNAKARDARKLMATAT